MEEEVKTESRRSSIIEKKKAAVEKVEKKYIEIYDCLCNVMYYTNILCLVSFINYNLSRNRVSII